MLVCDVYSSVYLCMINISYVFMRNLVVISFLCLASLRRKHLNVIRIKLLLLGTGYVSRQHANDLFYGVAFMIVQTAYSSGCWSVR